MTLALTLAACSGGSGGPNASTSSTGKPDRAPMTLAVPQDYPTIQAAVDVTVPGDLVLISPATYHEAVRVDTERIVIRGLDRNAVVLDGEHTRDDGIRVTSAGVAIENLTVRNYRFNGLLISPDGGPAEIVLSNYRVSYVSAYNNGLYGVYAFGARGGLIELSFASGHPDSGFYIGQCDPCDAVVRDVVAERNVVGFQATNASGNLFVLQSTWRRNRVGIQPNSDAKEGDAPQHDAVIVGNLVSDNDEAETPSSDIGDFGYGIALGGSIDDVVERNLVTGNGNSGITVVGDNAGFVASGNRIAGNSLSDNGVDLEYLTPTGVPNGNCFAANTFRSSFPDHIEVSLPCGAGPSTVPTARSSQRLAVPRGVDYRLISPPADQQGMRDPATAPVQPASGMPKVDVDRIKVPAQ